MKNIGHLPKNVRVKGLQVKRKEGDKSYKTDSFELGNTPEIVWER